jgi:hypothetical protein
MRSVYDIDKKGESLVQTIDCPHIIVFLIATYCDPALLGR